MGDLTTLGGSTINWHVGNGSTWAGTTHTDVGNTPDINVDLDNTTSWHLTQTTYVKELRDTYPNLGNIQSNGFNLFYESSGGTFSGTIVLPGGVRPFPPPKGGSLINPQHTGVSR